MIPHRVQRKRTKGWKMPAGTVYVGRPTIFGNPYVVGMDPFCDTHDNAVKMFLWYIEHHSDGINISQKAREQLKGKNLACWCSLDKPCHADVLLELANRQDTKD